MYLCSCKGVTDVQIRQLVSEGVRTVGAISAYVGVGNDCGKCLNDINAFLNRCLEESRQTELPVAPLQGTLSPDTGNSSRPSLVETAPQTKPEEAPQKAAWFAIDL